MASIEPPGPADTPSRRRGRGYWAPGLMALAALVAIGVAFGAGDLDHGGSSTTLRGSDVDQQMALAIQAEAATHAPPEVRCPASEPVRQGWRFVCSVKLGGSNRTIEVDEIDGRGHLRWQFNG